jgi:hypothetical protein
LLIKEKICSFYKQPNQITSILRILGIVFDFVISSGCAADMKIMNYATETLKINLSSDSRDICDKVISIELSIKFNY